MKTLHMTSPNMKGDEVVEAQKVLHRNRFGVEWFKGDPNGIYGPHTGEAARAAKHALGYPKRHVNEKYGAKLHAYLTRRKLGPLMIARRRARLWHAKIAERRKARETKGQRALHIARSQIGVKESPPGSNRVKFSVKYGVIGPWCAMFVSWCCEGAGLRFHYAYVPYVVRDAEADRNGLHKVAQGNVNARVDDGACMAACFVWGGANSNPDGDHIGFVAGHIDAHGDFPTVEGNTAVGNDSNGGEVMARTRNVKQVRAFVKVGA